MAPWASFVHKSVCMFIVCWIQSLQYSLSFVRGEVWILKDILWGGFGSDEDLRARIATRTAVVVVWLTSVSQTMVWSTVVTPLRGFVSGRKVFKGSLIFLLVLHEVTTTEFQFLKNKTQRCWMLPEQGSFTKWQVKLKWQKI